MHVSNSLCVDALNADVPLLALDHVVGEHGMEVGDGACQHDTVGAEALVVHLDTVRSYNVASTLRQNHPTFNVTSHSFP